MKTKNIFKLWIFVVVVFNGLNANECKDLRLDKDIVFGFFNGVKTTRPKADNALRLIREKFLNNIIEKDDIEYTLFYNKTEGFADFAETFDQRAKQHAEVLKDKYEYFWAALNSDNKWWEKIVDTIKASADLLKSEKDLEKSNAIAAIANLISKSKTTNIMYKNHQNKIDCIEDNKKKFLIFAHSQGNLFAVEAYDYTTKIKNTPKEAVALVHVAPASPVLRGSHFLVDQDLVINGLRVVGEVPDITDEINGYLNRPAGLNGKKDILGHGLLEIYLNPWLGVSGSIYTEASTKINSLEFPQGSDDDNSDDNSTTGGDDNNGDDNSTSGGGDNTGGSNTTDPSSFDYKNICTGIDFPDPIPSELEESINGILDSNKDNLVSDFICPLINTAVQAYNLSNGGGLPGGGAGFP